MSEPSSAVQKAIYTAIAAAIAPKKVYDSVPQGAAYPYVVMDAQEIINADFVDSRKDERFIYLSVWSQYRGQKEILDIMSQIDAALHHKSLAMDTGYMVQCFVQNKLTMRDSDNLTFQGSIKLRIITQH
jgi:hypothetical protein